MSATIAQAGSEDARRTRHPITMIVDLCLYRVVTECCAGRVLPLGIRQMIKAYAWVSVDDKTLWEAVRLWCIDRAKARLHQRLGREQSDQHDQSLQPNEVQ